MDNCRYNDELCKGEIRICNHCDLGICAFHSDGMAHLAYDCNCKSCGKTVAEGCKHGVPDWSKSKPVVT